LTDAVSAEIDVTKMILKPPEGPRIALEPVVRHPLGEEIGALEIGADDFSNDASLASVTSRARGAMPALFTSVRSTQRQRTVDQRQAIVAPADVAGHRDEALRVRATCRHSAAVSSAAARLDA
jgi:hypothetical protein